MTLAIESINYDYLPGEPESRRVPFITLRFAPRPVDIQIGQHIHLNSMQNKALIEAGWRSQSTTFKVMDIHGRNIVLEPTDVEGRYPSLNNARTGTYFYKPRPNLNVC